MAEKISGYPSLQAEDDGFLMQLRDDVIAMHLDALGLTECETISECVEKLQATSAYAVDKGASLPLYIPVCDDDGVVQGYKTAAVWAGEHIDVPLYGDIAPERVESLIKGVPQTHGALDEAFMAYSPAFRVALLVHHIVQNVSINPMAAEAFVLGRYGELGFEDSHFVEYGVPSTEVVQVSSLSGLRMEWVAISPTSYVGNHRLEQRISGWTIRVRGAYPKRETILGAWNDIRDRLDEPREKPYTINGKAMHRLDTRGSGIVRKRVGDPDVERMCSWIDDELAKGTFPKRGKQKNWQEAVSRFAKAYPFLSSRWTADSMRKAYQHHKSR